MKRLAQCCASRGHRFRSKGYAGLCMWSLCSDFAGQSREAADGKETCEQLYASSRLSAMSERAELEFGRSTTLLSATGSGLTRTREQLPLP